ncbi:methyltransferase [Trypanosoma rangeli]|uniref:Methyltransferase n=1 Tax=Trypanosoma rangeli TaxID=5698 RepID=A0A3R7NGZ3_TRYRA|nr:methyltransferase [Trypanosoma rangeli]RNF02545.1 methyltransferase [Trypanosoma rangeli]|eukprot:RNF02545.1 methyltransferase [Trypanosoma rangeli]
MLGRIFFFTSCASVLAGTAYVVGIALSPPPSYTVNNRQRLERYNALSHENAYEKQTRGQEFYLGISRWRRRMLRDEGLVHGRVLEVGAGCGGNVNYYEALLRAPSTVQLQEANAGGTAMESSQTQAPVVEIVMSDRSSGMVESTIRQIQQRYGYTPYRYPDYDVAGILATVEKNAAALRSGGGVIKRKIIHGDGSVVEVLSTPLNDGGDAFADGTVAPILQGALPGNQLHLLDQSGQEELNRREAEKCMKQSLVDGRATNESIFAVANYAAEQMPFSDNSFDTVVDMFGLCSFDDPVRALREMSRVCKPSGNILLLEHGKGRWLRINDYLDKWAPRHAKNWGCWWNRDIRRYLRLAGLTVVKVEEKHFGTSLYIVAKPFKSMDEWDAYNSKLAMN